MARQRDYDDGVILLDDSGDWVLGVGAAFPSGVAPNGALFWRTDIGQLCRYTDGAWSLDQTPKGRLIVPMGEIDYFNTTGTAVTIAAQSDGSTNMVQVSLATALDAASEDFDNGGANDGTLRYIGTVTRKFHIASTWSFVAATAGDVFVLGVAVNGSVHSHGKVIQTGAGTNNNGNANHILLELEPNDELSLYVGNLTAGRNATFKTFNLFAMGM